MHCLSSHEVDQHKVEHKVEVDWLGPKKKNFLDSVRLKMTFQMTDFHVSQRRKTMNCLDPSSASISNVMHRKTH